MTGALGVGSSAVGTALRCKGLHKRFGSTAALDGFELEVRRGELLVLFGPSGCGKTTALRVVAGIERPDAGEVWIGGRRVTGEDWVPPERRHVGMVFQDWALFPHLDVWHNVAFGLRGASDGRVRDILALVQMEGFERHMPHELSGGQQQRVALARALAPGPEVILLDEPFSNLDASLRSELRTEVRSVLRASGATAVFVTHDREEALSLADRIAVMAEGRVVQVGTPYEVYADPISALVAHLIGEANLLPVRVLDGVAETPFGPVPAPGRSDGAADMLVRPEDISLDPDPGGTARVTAVEFYGHDQLVRIRLADGTPLAVRTGGHRPAVDEGAAVRVSLAGRPRFFPR